jgi:hypothetical protein
MADYPEPNFAHLLRLSDEVGVLEHARGAVPLREHGYCVDDAARAVIVVCREPSPTRALRGLLGNLLALLVHAGRPDGTLNNRMGYDRRWCDSSGTGDWWGRALMAFGSAAALAPDTWMRCADGLSPQGRRQNQGAESTLALLSTLQHGRSLRGW